MPHRLIRRAFRCLAALALPLTAACLDRTWKPPPADPPRGASVPFRRVGEGALAIGDPGALVIRDAESLRTLWQRFADARISPPPRIDFTREMVAVVSMGGMDGCSSAARYVWRVEQGRDSLFVVLAYDGYPAALPFDTCAMVVAPVDVVVLARSDAPVAFTGYVSGYQAPPTPRWLDRPTVAQTDTMIPHWRDQYRLFMARDSATPREELARLIDGLDEQGTEALYGALLEHPRVQADLALLLRLVRPRQPSERMAQVLLERHGARLARDPATDREVLRLLLWRLDGEKGGYREVAAALIRHRTVLNDEQLLWDAYSHLTRKHITCAEGQRLWTRIHPQPPGGGRHPLVCDPWDDSPKPPDAGR